MSPPPGCGLIVTLAALVAAAYFAGAELVARYGRPAMLAAILPVTALLILLSVFTLDVIVAATY